MFVIEDNPRFTRDVSFRSPSGGGHRDDSVSVTFRALDVEQIDQADFTTKAGTSAFLNAIVADVAGFTDGSGNPVATTPEILARFLALSWVRAPLIRSYFSFIAPERLGN